MLLFSDNGERKDGTFKKDKDGNVIESFDKFIQLRGYFENHPIETFRHGDWRLLTKKWSLPYEYISPQHYLETELPSLKQFISKITGKSITLSKYEELKIIWISFGCHNLGEFLEIYLEYDVLMLTDIFENFQNECLANFHIDLLNFISNPSISYHAMILLSKVVFEPIPNLETCYFIQRAKRGGFHKSQRDC